MYLEIGKKITFEAVEADSLRCDGCIFQSPICNLLMIFPCHPNGRTDGKPVIFKEIKL